MSGGAVLSVVYLGFCGLDDSDKLKFLSSNWGGLLL